MARYEAEHLDHVVDAINATGYGLTLGVHSRITTTVDRVSTRAKVGNTYVNRNQIGAVVGVQPFGGERLSGTGPKAGGPHYLYAFTRAAERPPTIPGAERGAVTAAPGGGLDRGWLDRVAGARALQPIWDRRNDRHKVLTRAAELLAGGATGTAWTTALTDAADWARREFSGPLSLPGPTGEQNQLSLHGRGMILCLGNGQGGDALARQVAMALAAGNGIAAPMDEDLQAHLASAGVPAVLLVRLPEVFDARTLDPNDLTGIAAIAVEGDDDLTAYLAATAAARDGPIVPLLTDPDHDDRLATERTLSINTTAAGGNASLLALTE